MKKKDDPIQRSRRDHQQAKAKRAQPDHMALRKQALEQMAADKRKASAKPDSTDRTDGEQVVIVPPHPPAEAATDVDATP